MAVKVLIVDDAPEILEILTINLGRQGFIVRTAATGADALAGVKNDRPDIILLDIMLPDTSGTRLTSQFKNNPDTAAIPVILITARDSETDMIVGLSMGADDYITKPFSTPVLVARIETVLRRFAAAPGSDTLRAGPVTLIPNKYQVLVDSKPVELTLAEFRILHALIRAGGTVLSRSKLMEEFGSDPAVTERTIDVHIAALRKKLGPTARDCVKTLHRLGYRFEI